MINTILHARQITKIDDVYMVIGGSHLLNTPHQQQEKTMEAILDLGIKKVGLSHCTGIRPACFLANKLGPQTFFFNNAGTDITFSEGKIYIDAFEKYDV